MVQMLGRREGAVGCRGDALARRRRALLLRLLCVCGQVLAVRVARAALFTAAPPRSRVEGPACLALAGSQGREGGPPAGQQQTYGPVSFGGCDADELMEAARRAAESAGKREDPGMKQGLRTTQEYMKYAESRKGLWGKAVKDVKKHYTIFSKEVRLGTDRCVVSVRFDNSLKGKPSCVTTGSVPKWMRHAFIAMGIAFQ
mmetsp:Transcript_49848/g.153962  ORF Transcript_49848/g.153962 Transcript_49848/m.153962 type:complete len:200 (+) Transcript_49848:43-642(+)